MEHPCQRCGSPVEDGSPFCTECGAPQVRFIRDENPAENINVPQPDVTAPPLVPEAETWRETDLRVSGRERASAVRAALNGGLLGALLSLLPLGFVIGMPLGGFLAVLFYRRRSWRAEPSVLAGFRLGALAGIFASAILGVIIGADMAVSNHAADFQQQLTEKLRIAETRYPDPQQRQVIEYLMTPPGMKIAIVFTVILLGIFFVVISGVGGAVAASVLHRKGPRS